MTNTALLEQIRQAVIPSVNRQQNRVGKPQPLTADWVAA